MNDTPQLSADQVDELLSAELDGEFDAAARDLGLDPAAARAWLAGQGASVEARRAAFAAARDALSERPAVDELLAARVRAKASKAASEERETQQARQHAHRRQRFFAVTGGLAAAIAVVAGLAIVVRGSGNDTRKTTSAAGGAAVTKPPQAYRAASGTTEDVEFGAVADVPALIARVRSSAKALATSRPETGAPVDANQQLKKAPAPCDAAASQVSGVTGVTRRGVATLAGAPVRVYVFRKGANDVVVVLSADCKLVSSQTLPAASG